LQVATYVPIACPTVDIDGQDIIAVADPNKSDIYIPEDEYDYDSRDGVDHEEYFVINKVLHCYKKQYKIQWGNPSIRACYTTLDPVEITSLPVAVPASKTISVDHDQPIITTTESDKPITITTPPKRITTKTIPSYSAINNTTSNIVTTKTIPTPSKRITTTSTVSVYTTSYPSNIDDGYTTECNILDKYVTLTTSLNSPTETNVPVYSLVPKTYEICVKTRKVCKTLVSDALLQVATYVPIACPTVDIDGQDIIAVADPNQKDIYIPEIEYDYNSRDGVDHEEYFVINKVLHCYKKQYK